MLTFTDSAPSWKSLRFGIHLKVYSIQNKMPASVTKLNFAELAVLQPAGKLALISLGCLMVLHLSRSVYENE